MVALLSTAPEFQLGDTVEGRYQIIRKLADGGMGTVYLAEHVLIRRRVALKLLHAELAADSAMVRRFMNEASAAGTLGHPHIVESTDMGFTRNGIPYIVFEYLEGCLLIEEVYRLGGLPVRRALHIASQIASALEAAHNAKIVHLDLKSDNVFLIDRGESFDHAKVLDFGISRFLEVELDRGQGGCLAGTPEFMAPEQVTMPDLVDGRADIYALGVLLYEMLSARTPHVNVDRRMLLQQIVNDPPAPLDRIVPPALERLLFDKLLAKSRDHRIQTMREVKAALDDLATSLRAATSDSSLFTYEEPSKEIDISFTDGPLLEPVPVIARAPAPEAVPVIAPAMVSAPVPVLAPATVRVPATPPRGPRAWWVAVALVGGLAGGALFLVEDQQNSSLQHAARAAIESDAASIGAMLAMEARTARERAESLASTPMLRAAIETDAATISDMVADGQLFHPRSGEVLELTRTQGSREVLLRAPSSAPPLVVPDGTAGQIVVDDTRLLVIASAAVRSQNGELGGMLALATPIDLAPTERLVAQHAAKATLVGLDRPLVIVRRPSTLLGEPVVVPIVIGHEIGGGQLSLVAATEPALHPENLSDLRYASWALAAVLFAIYTLGWLVYGIRAAGTLRARAKPERA